MAYSMEGNASYRSYMKSPFRSAKHTTYFPVYDELFSSYRGKNITFIEIGVLDGGSLFMWRDYFGPQARIIGVELNPEAKKWEDEGFEIFVGSQSDPDFWDSFFANVGNVDIVLDDGGHTFEQQIMTTECCIPHVNNGGLLVVEDTHTSYMPEFGGPAKYSFVNYAKNIVDGINFRFGELSKTKDHEENIFSVRFFESFVVFDVRRQYSEIVSEPTENGGKSAGAADYRYADSRSLTEFKSVGYSLRGLKGIPVAGYVLSKTYEFMLFRVLRILSYCKQMTLKKYFRY